VLNPNEVERWLHGLGSLLPREAVAALADEVRYNDMDGEAFDALVASRAMPQLGDSVRPAHMATLRRCWNASRPPPSSSSGVPAKSASDVRFAPPPRRPDARPKKRETPVHKSEPELPELPEWSPHDTRQALAYCDETDAEADLVSDISSKDASKRPAQVPRLDLTFIHRNAGHRGEGAEELQRHQWKQPERRNAVPKTIPSSSSTAAVPPEGTSRIGFASASPEDQQRIAEFYGYRDEGFVATMNGLRTDLIRPRLYIGNMADAAYWPLLKGLGITHVVNCAVEAQKVAPAYENQGVKYLLLPFHDREEQATSLTRQRFKTLRDATKYIHACLKGKSASNNNVLIHCVQGLSRSAALACAYLMEYEGLTFERAMSEIKSKHRGCLSAVHWQTMLHKFNAELLKGS